VADIEVVKLLDKGLYLEQIYKVQDYIERNIEMPLKAEALSRLVGFSPFHFQRVFSLVTGESLHSFIKRIRLEKAAYLLLSDPSRSILDIALHVGFSNQASFAKAFKSRFEMSASQYRKNKKTYSKSNFLPKRIVNQDMNVKPLSIEVKVEHEIQVIYVRYSGPYKGDSQLFTSLFEKLYQWAGQRQLINEKSRWFVIYHDQGDETDEDALRLSVCLSVEGNVAVGGSIGLMCLPEGKYGVGRFKVNAQEYGKAWYHMYTEWIENSPYTLDDRYAFEHYPPQSEEEDVQESLKKQVVEIYIPIQ